MTPALFVEQTFNGLQFGLLLFLVAVGITLVFGVMDLVNLSHGSMVMLGGYMAAAVLPYTGGHLLMLPVALAGVAAIAVLVEVLILRRLYRRGHLDQVLATFGLILVFNEGVVMLFGRDPIFQTVPAWLSGTVTILPGVPYPAYRLAITAVAIALGVALHLLIARSRLGMLIRAGADKRHMVQLLGVDIAALYTAVFALGAVLAAFAGIMLGPIVAVRTGMGDPILILALVCVIIGGLGSVRGALVGALLVGLVDTFGRVFLPSLLGPGTGQAIANMSVYILMAAILVWRPAGMLGGRR
jgi:branched-chain amino acid transport system permease protein